MSQPLPSRQRKAWLPPSFSALRYPAIPRPTSARTTTIQSGCPGVATTGSAVARFTFAMGLLSARGRAFCAKIIAQTIPSQLDAKLDRPSIIVQVDRQRVLPLSPLGRGQGEGPRRPGKDKE